MRLGAAQRFIFFLSVATMATSALAQGELVIDKSISSPSRFSELNWKLSLSGASETEGQDETVGVKSEMSLDVALPFLQQSKIFISPGVRLFSTRSQEQFDEDPSTNRLLLREAYVMHPFFQDRFSLTAGAISQGRFQARQLISSGDFGRSFPAVLAVGKVISDSDNQTSLNIFAERAVPTSFSFNSYREEKESLPGLNVVGLSFAKKLSRDWVLSSTLGEFTWSNLPGRVALASQKLGNSIGTGDGIANQEWVTNFQSQYLNVDITYCIDCERFIGAGYSRSQNLAADSSSRDAQLIEGRLGMRQQDDKYTLKLAQFFAESDVTPAAYASGGLGYTNRQGQSLRLEWENDKSQVKFFVRLLNAEPIAASPYQKKLTDFSIGVETNGSFLE